MAENYINLINIIKFSDNEIEMKTTGWERAGVKDDDDAVVVGDVGAGSKSDLDVIHGFDFDSSVEPEETAPERLMSRSLVVIVSTVSSCR